MGRRFSGARGMKEGFFEGRGITDMLMIRPEWEGRCGMSAWTRRRGARTLVFIILDRMHGLTDDGQEY